MWQCLAIPRIVPRENSVSWSNTQTSANMRWQNSFLECRWREKTKKSVFHLSRWNNFWRKWCHINGMAWSRRELSTSTEEQRWLKSKGWGIMISDFVEEYGGFLQLTNNELKRVQEIEPTFPRQAWEVFPLGKTFDGHWTNAHLMANVRKAAAIAMFKYPR